MNNRPSIKALYQALDFERVLDLDAPADRLLYVADLHTQDGSSPVNELREQVEPYLAGVAASLPEAAPPTKP